MSEQTGGPFDFNDAPAQRAGAVLQAFSQTEWDQRLTVLRTALSDRTSDLISEIFPRARIHAGEARIGNLDGDTGESLAIALTGAKAGLWTDHATGQGGDLIDLWRETNHATFITAVDDLEHWAGLSKSRRPAWSSPIVKLGAQRKATAASEPKPDASLGAPVQSWHYYSADGVILGKVSKYILANGEKTYRPFNASGEMKPPDPRPLYRLPNIRTAQTVIFVEGEKCADKLSALGYEATSAMQGANTLIEKTDWSPLAGKTVILWPDNDQPGLDFMARVAPILEGIGCTLAHVVPPSNKPEKWDAADAVDAGEEISDYLPTIQASERPPAQRFQILTIDELFDIKPPEWRIDGIFPTHGTSAVYGAFESFKSFVGIDFAMALATGQKWQGRETKPTNVLYVAGEGQHGLAHRVYGWCATKNGGGRPSGFRALPEALAIPLPGDTDALMKSIDVTGLEFGLIIFDTLTRMSGGTPLNSEEAMQAYIRGSDRVRLATGAHVMHVGHTGKDKERGLMGSVVLSAAMETIIYVERQADSLKLINSNPQGKQKDGPNFDDIRLQARTVHFERNGEDATTRILVEDNEIVNENKERKLGPRQARVLDLIATATRAGQIIGFNRLLPASGLDNGSLGKALRDLNEKGLIVEAQSGEIAGWKLP